MKKYGIFLFPLIFFIFLLCIHTYTASAASSPYDVSSTVKKNWNKIHGGKEYKMETGKNLTYDVYKNKFLDGGYKIETKNFGKGSKQYLHFYGWAILFGHKTHTPSNHETYIALQNTSTQATKVYGTLSYGNRDATIDVAYNRYFSDGLYKPCPSGTTNKSNLTCNMRYEDVAFSAYIPIDELFPDITKKGTWKMYIVKRVDSRIVYTELHLPFKFNDLAYGLGSINMTSGVDANLLTINSVYVIRRTIPRAKQTGTTLGYFTQGKKYVMKKTDESKETAVWFGVRSTHKSDYGKIRWVGSPYVNFGGTQAVIEYKPEFDPDVAMRLSSIACPNVELKPTIQVINGKGVKNTLSVSSSYLTWTSSKPSVISVSNDKIKTLKPGASTITVTYKDPYTKKSYKASKKVTVMDCPDTPTEPGTCGYDYGKPKVSDVMQKSTAINANGSIAAESTFDVSQGIPVTEDLQTAASSEKYVYDQVFQNKTGVLNISVPVKKKYILKWTEKFTDVDGKETSTPQSLEVEVNKNVEIKRNYSYWDIGYLRFYQLNNIMLFNYAFSGQSNTLTNTNDVDLFADHQEQVERHVFPAKCDVVDLGSKTIDGGDKAPELPEEDFTGEVDKKIGKNKVKNDSVSLDEEVVMNDEKVEEKTEKPKDIPEAEKVSLENHNITIPTDKVNYYQAPSNGAANYDNTRFIDSLDDDTVKIPERDGGNESGGDEDGGDDQGGEYDDGTGEEGEYDGGDSYEDDEEDGEGEGEEEEENLEPFEYGFNVNFVTIHTPIYLKGNSSDEEDYDQRVDRTPHKTKNVLILDRKFNVDLSATGTHRNIPGYGTRDYSKYIAYKEVKFPFDVYEADKSSFHPANTWIRLSGSQTTAAFFLPIWVPEDEYTIKYREYAINAPSDSPGSEEIKNVTIPNGSFDISPAGTRSAAHMVTDEIKVDVVGRVYDFRVTDVSDYNWENVFRTGNGVEHTDNYFWVGTKNRDGLERGNDPAVTLPIMQGKHTLGYKNVAVKTGYRFSFDLKTMGNMFANNDAIRIIPKFYFVEKNGQNRREVDLYYHDASNYFVKVGSEEDKTFRTVVLNKPLRNLDYEDLRLTADYYYRHAADFGYTTEATNSFYKTFIRNYIRKDTKKETITGPYGWQILNWNLRNYIGPKVETVPTNTMIPSKDTLRSEQQWFGEYSIPAKVYVVDKGKDIAGAGILNRLNENHPMFLKNGYIIVNFEIETIQNGKIDNPYLRYVNGSVSNEWKREGFQYSYTDPYGYIFNLNDGDVLFYHADESSNDDFSSGVTH